MIWKQNHRLSCLVHECTVLSSGYGVLGRSSLGFISVELDRLPNPLSCSTLLICPICISNVLIDAPWFLMAASVEAQISLIKLEFFSCLFADPPINLLKVSSIDSLRSWYEGFALFL
ncbi:hypothetical protein Tco_1099526, partial [Tanacetum coccineum]